MTQQTESGREAAERAERATEINYSAAVVHFRDLSMKLIDMARANIEGAFDFAQQAAAARAPNDVMGLWTAHISKQLQVLNAQTRELSELAQKFTADSAAATERGGKAGRTPD